MSGRKIPRRIRNGIEDPNGKTSWMVIATKDDELINVEETRAIMYVIKRKR